MLQKKGAIGVQFNWIFVLIVGGLIVAFFMVVIQNQMEGADYETQVTVQTKLNSIMQNAVQNPGSLFEITLKDTEMRVDDCNEGFYLNNNRNLRVDMEAAFSPDLIKSKRNKVLFWTLPWQMPFKITNFMYVTNKDVRYVVVNGTDEDSSRFAEEIFESDRRISLHKEINKQFVNFTDVVDLQDKNNYKIRLIFFEPSIDIPRSRLINLKNNLPNDVEVTAVVIDVQDSQGGLDGWGSVTYLDEEGNEESLTSFLGRASLIGAIFAEDQKQYDCVMTKAYQRMGLVSQVLYDRTEALKVDYCSLSPSSMNSCCTSFNYHNAKSIFEDMARIYCEGGVCYGCVPFPFAKCLYDYSNSLKTYNHNMQLKSCATIY